mgnify:CR=1 FL=1
MNRIVMLSTIDNPFDPLTQWDEWLAYDEDNGYYTNCFLSRVIDSLFGDIDDYNEEDQGIAIEKAIDEIVKYNVHGVHKKLVYQNA